MELKTFQDLLSSDPSKLISKVIESKPKDDGGAKYYQPENHEVMDESIRKDRTVYVPQLDEYGDPKQNDGKTLMKRETEKVARIPSNIEKQIVDWAVQIAAGVPVEMVTNKLKLSKVEQRMFDMVKLTIKDNKLEYLDQEILRLRGIHKLVMEVWYSETTDPEFWDGLSTSKVKMRVMLMSAESGDDIYPVKNSVGKLITVGRGYVVTDEEGKELNKFDLFSETAITTFTQTGGLWEKDEYQIPALEYGKLNLIIHEQPRREYEDILPKRKQLEFLDSDLSDQNQATGSPLIAVTGEVNGFGKRGDTGKVFELEKGGDIKIVESTKAPEAIKFERENLIKDIFDSTNTPHISFDNASSYGSNIPGITLKLLFLPATLKALGKQSGGWGMAIQRRYNFLKTAMSVLDKTVKPALGLDISPKFGIYMPENTVEKYDNIIKLVAAGLLSKKKAIEMLGIVDDVEAEWEALEEEAAKAAEKMAKAQAAKSELKVA